MIQYYSDYQTILYYKETQVLEQIWLEKTIVMQEDQFYNESEEFYRFFELYDPQSVLINTESMFFSNPDALMNGYFSEPRYFNKEIASKIALFHGNKSMKHFPLKDFIAKASVFDRTLKGFKNEDLAIDWILEGKWQSEIILERKTKVA